MRVKIVVQKAFGKMFTTEVEWQTMSEWTLTDQDVPRLFEAAREHLRMAEAPHQPESTQDKPNVEASEVKVPKSHVDKMLAEERYKVTSDLKRMGIKVQLDSHGRVVSWQPCEDSRGEVPTIQMYSPHAWNTRIDSGSSIRTPVQVEEHMEALRIAQQRDGADKAKERMIESMHRLGIDVSMRGDGTVYDVDLSAWSDDGDKTFKTLLFRKMGGVEPGPIEGSEVSNQNDLAAERTGVALSILNILSEHTNPDVIAQTVHDAMGGVPATRIELDFSDRAPNGVGYDLGGKLHRQLGWNVRDLGEFKIGITQGHRASVKESKVDERPIEPDFEED